MLLSKYDRDTRKKKILICLTAKVEDNGESEGLDVLHVEHSHNSTLGPWLLHNHNSSP